MILAGLWYSKVKPLMQKFIDPIVKELTVLETTGQYSVIQLSCIYTCIHQFIITPGVEVHPPNVAQVFWMTVHVICCSCNLPARALIQNFIQFNGIYGCGFCEQRGVVVGTERGGNVLTFLYDQLNPTGPARTQAKCLNYAKEATENHKVVCFNFFMI